MSVPVGRADCLSCGCPAQPLGAPTGHFTPPGPADPATAEWLSRPRGSTLARLVIAGNRAAFFGIDFYKLTLFL